MAILAAKDQEAIRKEFARLTGPVKLVVFSQELVAGELCRQNEQLMKEVAGIMGEIAAASQEQTTGIEQINRAISQMDQVVKMNA